MTSTPHILIVDDHAEIRDLLAKYLAKHEIRVTVADGGRALRETLRTSAIDLIVLDVMMPGEDGLSLCRHLRETTNIPVILLTAMAEETDRVVGLEIGADDYLTKPFNPRELLARIRAVLRRANSLPKQRVEATADRYAFGEWRLDTAQREIIGNDNIAIPLSTAEFHLLLAFVEHPKIVLSRDRLLDLTRGKAANVFDRSIDNQVSRLRKKVEPDPKNPTVIKTVWGGGYLFAADVTTL
ncbi:MAG: response regulator [Alphaproteobacteria bacterium]|nr:response regulator [Alphaproteobacteria bacterium]